MSVIEIPVRSDLYNWSLAVELEEVPYQLAFVWNVRDVAWYMDIRSADGTDLLNGIPVRVDTPLNGKTTSTALPPGYLIAVDTSGEAEDIEEPEEFGDRVKLFYIESADL